MMRWLLLCLVIVVMRTAMCKPVANKRGPPQPNVVEGGSKAEEDVGTGLEYDRYLRQVVEVLESDDEFRKKLENANISDIKSGAIAMHLELVNNTIRTKLDEIKRMEVQRLQELARLRIRHMKGIKNMEIPGHLDLKNPHSFEMQDLESLIKKTTNDLEEVDKRRKEDFKTYEMEKEYEYREKLNHLPAEEQAKVKQHHEELQKKHKQHEKLNHPGSRDQFQEVWEKDDHLDQEFDPKTFFMMHDLNGDKLWDFQEVEAVLQRELDKVYDAKNPTEEDDPNERYEEMNRMREHVFKEIDQNKDLMISEEEFIAYTGRHGENKKFQEDEGWESINDTPEFTDEEYEEYLRQFHPQPGVVPPPVDGTDNLQFSPEEHLRLQQQHQQQQQQQGLHQPGTGAQQAGHPQQGLNQQQQHMQQFQQHPGQAGGGQAAPTGIHPDPNQQQQLHQQQQFNQQQLNHQQQQQLNQQQLNQQQLNHQQQQQLNQQQLNQQQHQQQQQQLNQQQVHQQQQQNNQQHLNQQQAGQPIQGQGQPAQGHGQPVQGQAQPGQGHPPAQPVHGQPPVV